MAVTKLENIITVIKLIRSKDRTVEEIKQATGIHEGTVYIYLGALYESGLVDRAKDMKASPRAAGRKPFIYTWTDSLKETRA